MLDIAWLLKAFERLDFAKIWQNLLKFWHRFVEMTVKMIAGKQ